MMVHCQPRSFFSPNPLSVSFEQSTLENFTVLSYRSSDLEAYLTEITHSVNRLTQSDWTIITLCDGRMGQIIASSIDLNWDNAFALHGTLANEVVKSGRSLLINQSHQDRLSNLLPEHYRGYLGIPLRTQNRTAIGTICTFQYEPCLFTEAVITMVEGLAARAAIAIENYQLYQQQLQFNQQLSQAVTNCSIDLKQSQDKLIERERLAAIGEFVAIIVHEIRNPLTTVEMGLRYAQKVLPSDADQQRLDLALSESHRLTRLLQEILCYAKPQVLSPAKLNISQFLAELFQQIQDLPEATERYIHYINDFPEVEVMADIDKLRQVFLNLLRNAFEAIAPQETVRCWLTQGTRPDWISIQFHNGGEPIPPELLPQLTTPFCSTKPSGTGLGLAISKRIITAHGGKLEIISTTRGTTVSVHLPIICG